MVIRAIYFQLCNCVFLEEVGRQTSQRNAEQPKEPAGLLLPQGKKKSKQEMKRL